MQERDVKIALENYHYFINSIEPTQWKIDELNGRRFKAGGSIAKMPENPIDRSTVIINNLEKLEELTRLIDMYQYYISIANEFMSCLMDTECHKDSSMIRDKYIRRKSIEWISMNHNMAKRTVWRRIDYLVRKYVEQT